MGDGFREIEDEVNASLDVTDSIISPEAVWYTARRPWNI